MLQILMVGMAIMTAQDCDAPPALRVVGDIEYYLYCNETYKELGAEAFSNCSGKDITNDIKAVVDYWEQGNWSDPIAVVTPDKPGIYRVRYGIDDAESEYVNENYDPVLYGDDFSKDYKVAERIVTVWDVVQFEILGKEYIEGDEETVTYWECGVSYEDPGFKVRSYCTGDDIYDYVVVEGLDALVVPELYDPTVPEEQRIEYEITYTLKDYPYLEKPITKRRLVRVIDTVSPTISLKSIGARDIELSSVNAAFWNDVKAQFSELPGDTPPYNLPTLFRVAPSNYREVSRGDSPPPPETFNGADWKPFYWFCNIPYVDPGCEVFDDCNGRINPGEVLVIITRYREQRDANNDFIRSWEDLFYLGTLGQMSSDRPTDLLEQERWEGGDYYGNYRAIYIIWDKSGNPTPTNFERQMRYVVRSRLIVPYYVGNWTFSTIAPRRQCGESKINLLEGVSLYDYCTGDLTGTITVTGDYDPGVPGSYLIRYDGYNSYGNAYTNNRTIIVEDNIDPEIALLSSDGRRISGTGTVDYIPWCAWRDGIYDYDPRIPEPFDPETLKEKEWWEKWFAIIPGEVAIVEEEGSGTTGLKVSLLLEAKAESGEGEGESAEGELGEGEGESAEGELGEGEGESAEGEPGEGEGESAEGELGEGEGEFMEGEIDDDLYVGGYLAVDACEGDVTRRVALTGALTLRDALEFMAEASTHLGEDNPENWYLLPYVFTPEISEYKGEYPFWLSVVDSSQNKGEAGRIIKVLPTYPVLEWPAEDHIECNAPEDQWRPVIWDRTDPRHTPDGKQWQCKATEEELIISREVECTSCQPSRIVPDGEPFVSGETYRITYKDVTNALGYSIEQASMSKELVCIDTAAPVVTVTPDSIAWNSMDPFYWDVHVKATADDLCDGRLEVGVIEGEGYDGLDPENPQQGQYNLILTARDNAGNIGTAILKVDVMTDWPEIILTGPSTMTLECNASFEEPGYRAEDGVDGALPVTVGGTVVDGQVLEVPGTYTVTYEATDSDGNNIRVIRTILVKDTTSPVLTLNGLASITIRQGQTFTDPGAVAQDACGDVDLTATILQSGGPVITDVPGSYVLTYRVADAAGNTATAVRTVRVVKDESPIISLKGDEAITVECGSPFTDPGVAAEDKDGNDLTAAVRIGGDTVNMQVSGVYTIRYAVTDSNGNDAEPVSRVVTVADTQDPQITLQGDNPIKLQYGGVFTDPGATATDTCDGDMSATIKLSGDTVSTTVAKTYTLRYTVADKSGNETVATRQVIVSNITVTVPDLTNLTPETAAVSLLEAKLVLGNSTQHYSDTVPTGHIISQSPMAGSGVLSGNAIAIKVSKGPQGAAEEGEDLVEGEGGDEEGEAHGEGEGQDDNEPGGCCGPCERSEKESHPLKRFLGDYLLFGLASLSLFGLMNRKR